MKCGVAAADITPPVGIRLLGTQAASSGVSDPLLARALVLDDGADRACIITLDLVGLDLNLADRIRSAIGDGCGIAPARTMLNCSHTHSAPFSIPWSVLGWKEFAEGYSGWVAELIEKTVRMVRSAAESLVPTELRSGRAEVRIGANRRTLKDSEVVMEPNPRGPAVPWVDVLVVETADARPLAVLFSHAAHPVIIHAASDLISADYPGFAADEIRRQLGRETLAMFAQACGGDINADPLKGGAEAAETAGRELGEAAVRAVQNGKAIDGSRVSSSSNAIELELEEPPTVGECSLLLQGARQEFERRKENSAEQELWPLEDAAQRYESLLKIAEEPDKDRRLRFELQVFGIDDEFCLVGMAHEVFSEYQLHAEEVSRFRHTMTLGYTNGCESYVPTAEALSLGGYEGSRSGAALAYRNRLRLRPDCEQRIKALLRQHLG